MNWGYGDIMLCNVNSDVTLAAPQSSFGYKTCQAVYSMALTARASGRDLRRACPMTRRAPVSVRAPPWVGNKYLGHFKTL